MDYKSRLRKLKVQTNESSEPAEVQVDDGDSVASLLPKICRELGVARNVDEYGLLLSRESFEPSAMHEATDGPGDKRASFKSAKKRGVHALASTSAGVASSARLSTLRPPKRSAVDAGGGAKGLNALFVKFESRERERMEKLKRKLKTDDDRTFRCLRYRYIQIQIPFVLRSPSLYA